MRRTRHGGRRLGPIRGRVKKCDSRRLSLGALIVPATFAATLRCSSGREDATELRRADASVETPDAAAGDGASPGDPCSGGPFGEPSDGAAASISGTATVELAVSRRNEILSLETTLVVPAKPPPTGTTFLWPGLQPSPGEGPPGVGVLQTVLTFGPTCAPDHPADPYEGFWVSAEYVNLESDAGRYTGCLGGDGMIVEEGSALHMSIRRDGATFRERVTDERSDRAVTFEIDLGQEPQRRALFAIEQREGAAPITGVFMDTRVTFALPEPAACQPASRGVRDAFSVPRASRDGRTCCLDRIELVSDGAR